MAPCLILTISIDPSVQINWWCSESIFSSMKSPPPPPWASNSFAPRPWVTPSACQKQAHRFVGLLCHRQQFCSCLHGVNEHISVGLERLCEENKAASWTPKRTNKKNRQNKIKYPLFQQTKQTLKKKIGIILYRQDHVSCCNWIIHATEG